MKIKFLGTGASEGVPAIFCQCDICKNARAAGGREIRTRCQAIINDELLLDFGPDTYAHILRYSMDITEIRYCLITHTHSDHLYPEDIDARAHGFAILDPALPPLTIIGSGGVRDIVVRRGGNKVTDDGRVIFRQAFPFEPVEFEGYRVIPISAIHSTKEPLVYIVTHGGKTLLYAHDTDVLPDGTLYRIAEMGIFFDLVSMDCTEGIKHINYRGHMNIERDLIFRQKLCDLRLAGADTVFVANHFSHNGRLSYAHAVEDEINRGLLIAYDGMELQI